jgi:hypothetical protein
MEPLWLEIVSQKSFPLKVFPRETISWEAVLWHRGRPTGDHTTGGSAVSTAHAAHYRCCGSVSDLRAKLVPSQDANICNWATRPQTL